MSNKIISNNKKVMNAIYIGVLCSVSYLSVYFARNILGSVTPQMIESGFTEEYIGRVSSLYFIFYAVGQLINGIIGDRVKAKYMISTGLFMAGITNVLFSFISVSNPNIALVIYGFTGFFLSMIYGPMTKTVAENTEPIYATRCSLGYTLASFLGSPAAGLVAAFLSWSAVFTTSSILLGIMAIVFFFSVVSMEKKGIIKYSKYERSKEENVKGGIKILIKHHIITFSLIAIITGIVRTTVVFWLPTYTSQHLGFSAETSALIFTISTFIISFTALISVFVYERLKRNINLTILIMFSASTIFFVLCYLIKQPTMNIIFITLAIMASNASATMLWSIYCPSLRDTGMVSSATGFLDFLSYMAASASSIIFANATSTIGWKNLILIWSGLELLGVIVALTYKSKSEK